MKSIENFKHDCRKGRAGHGLMDYGVPKGNSGKTMIYDGYLVGGNPFPMDTTARVSFWQGICSKIRHFGRRA